MFFITALKLKNSRLIINIPEANLYRNHEEADTRILLHAKHASLESQEPIILRSPDTDVLVLAVSLYVNEQLLFRRVQKNYVWAYVDVTNIASTLRQSVCDDLIGINAFMI